jgi:hypothetical protein
MTQAAIQLLQIVEWLDSRRLIQRIHLHRVGRLRGFTRLRPRAPIRVFAGMMAREEGWQCPLSTHCGRLRTIG